MQVFISFQYPAQGGIVGSDGNSKLCILKKSQAVLQSDCISLTGGRVQISSLSPGAPYLVSSC